MKQLLSTRLSSPESYDVISVVSDSGVQHPDKVLENRRYRFDKMGFVSYVADFLTRSRIDVTQMESLLAKDCPHDLAIQILMGTAWYGEDEHWKWSEKDEKELLDESPDE